MTHDVHLTGSLEQIAQTGVEEATGGTTANEPAPAGLIGQWVSAQPAEVPLDVVRFLENHSFLLPVLRKAPGHIRQYFGDAVYSYSLFTNPEDGSATTKLVLSIHPQMPPAEAHAAYRQFQHAWWVSAMPQTRGALIITPEYR